MTRWSAASGRPVSTWPLRRSQQRYETRFGYRPAEDPDPDDVLVVDDAVATAKRRAAALGED